MSVIIEIDSPDLLPQLVDHLRSADCAATPISSQACRVVYWHADGEDQALYELSFFAKAWAEGHGPVGMRLQRPR